MFSYVEGSRKFQDSSYFLLMSMKTKIEQVDLGLYHVSVE